MSKLALVTGGNRGLGFASAQKLAARGMQVVITSRRREEGEAAAARICNDVPGADVTAMVLDLASMASVRAFAADFNARFDHLDVLLCSAGVMQQSEERLLSVDGHEVTFATNHLGHFLLVHLLLDRIKASSARVVVVSSRLHMPNSGRGDEVNFDFDDYDLAKDYSPSRAYKNSKLCNLWFAYELNRRLDGSGATANAVCPGFVPTTAAESTHGVMKLVMKYLMPHMPFAHSVDEATDTFVTVATDATLGGGGFYGEGKAIESSPESHDDEKARRLWGLSARLCGIE